MNNGMEDVQNSAHRRIAVLLAALEPAAREAVLGRLPDEITAGVRTAMACLADVDKAERTEVLQDFLGGMRQASQSRPSPAQLDGGPLAFSDDALSLEELIPRIPLDTLSRITADEHPQTKAVIVAMLAPQRAARMLRDASVTERADILHRVLALDDADPMAVEEVREYLVARIRAELAEKHRTSQRFARVQAILGAADPSLRADLLGAIQNDDQAMLDAEPGRENASLEAWLSDPVETSVRFDRLVDCADGVLTEVFQTIPLDVTAVALSGASQPTRNDILARLPADVAAPLVERLGMATPVRIADIHLAQAIVLRLIATTAPKISLQQNDSQRITLSA